MVRRGLEGENDVYQQTSVHDRRETDDGAAQNGEFCTEDRAVRGNDGNAEKAAGGQ